jgi:hypothetical protein
MKKVTLAQVKKSIKNNGRWTGYIVASKVSEYHVAGGWHLGHQIDVAFIEDLERAQNAYSFHNCNYELGYGLHYYEV